MLNNRSATFVWLLAVGFALCLLSLAAGAASAAPRQSGPPAAAATSQEDPRIRRIEYSADAVVAVQTRRGQVTHIVLAADEQLIGEPATGQGANCEAPQDTWCVAVGETRRDIFVKPREGAQVNNLSVITSRRRYAFELVPADRGVAAMRVVMTVPPPSKVEPPKPAAPASPAIAIPQVPPPLTTAQLVANRLRAEPLVRNADYTVALGPQGDDLVPTLVFDDGRATYFRFSGNKPLPAVFATGVDGSEETVNLRATEDGLLVTDRVMRRFVLRLGNAAVAILNEAFDAEGVPPKEGTTTPGVQRVVLQQEDKGSTR